MDKKDQEKEREINSMMANSTAIFSSSSALVEELFNPINLSSSPFDISYYNNIIMPPPPQISTTTTSNTTATHGNEQVHEKASSLGFLDLLGISQDFGSSLFDLPPPPPPPSNIFLDNNIPNNDADMPLVLPHQTTVSSPPLPSPASSTVHPETSEVLNSTTPTTPNSSSLSSSSNEERQQQKPVIPEQEEAEHEDPEKTQNNNNKQ